MESGAALIGALPDYRIRARNLSRYAANKIHDDEVARRHGYAAGLVAGTTVYAYMTHPLVAAWGLDWLARGSARLALLRPVYDGDEVTVETRVTARSGTEAAGEVAAEVTALTARGPAATLLAGLDWGGPALGPDLGGYPAAPLPAVPPPASEAALAGLDPLGSPALPLDEGEVAGYAADVDDPLPVYPGPDGVAHPGLLLQQANRALAENVALGPWVHVTSESVHCGLARVGERVTTRGRVARVFEKKGHRFVELDLLLVADDERPVMLVRHVAIYELRGGSHG